MTQIIKRNLIVMLACLLGLLAARPALAAKALTEDQAIADLASPKEDVAIKAMMTIEKEYPSSSQGVAEIKKHLSDPRPKVRRKAARVLGVLHAEVSSEDIKQICALFKADDHREVMDGLIALRGLKAQEALPEIRALLKNDQPNVVRDACRTLAVLGDKSDIALIQPLLENKDKGVQKDARDAIHTLESK